MFAMVVLHANFLNTGTRDKESVCREIWEVADKMMEMRDEQKENKNPG